MNRIKIRCRKYARAKHRLAPDKKASRPLDSTRCEIFISCFYSLILIQVTRIFFVFSLGKFLLRRNFDPHGQQAYWDIDAYANIRRSLDFMTASICRFVLCQPERILIYLLYPEELRYTDFCDGENVFTSTFIKDGKI